MSNLIVDIADCKVSNDPSATLATYALGSCLAVAIYDPAVKVGGLLHLMLPQSTLDPAKAEKKPFMFADTGIPTLFHKVYALGAEKRRLRVFLAGAAQIMDDNGVFNIGKRNHLAARRILWQAGVLVHGEEVGGSISRNVRLDLVTGGVWLRPSGQPERLLSGSA